MTRTSLAQNPGIFGPRIFGLAERRHNPKEHCSRVSDRNFSLLPPEAMLGLSRITAAMIRIDALITIF